MPEIMKVQTALFKGVLGCVSGLVLTVAGTSFVHAQALLVEELPGGTHLVLVNQPLADATSLVWPLPAGEAPSSTGEIIAGRLTLAADVEAALGQNEGDDDPEAVPPVVVAVGGVSAEELSSLLERVLGKRVPYAVDAPDQPVPLDGGLDRRLGAPGSDAFLRLWVPLPAAGDWRRSSVEVLWDLAPQLVADSVPHLQSRVEARTGVLEGRIDAELAEVTVSDLRLSLARFAADPALSADDVAEARRRLRVRRHADLEEHPEAARTVLDRWLAGGEEAVREYIFGIQGVTVESVRAAAAEWLPTHPGRAQLMLPPRVFNPRFAVGPEILHLDNDLTAAVLERSGAPLAVVCLRPVMVPDLDGQVTATVLARLARELRAADNRPGAVRVRSTPPLIEIAGPPDGFGELMEQLTTAYDAVTKDASPVASAGGDARRRALDLMAGVLGITEEDDPSPAILLRPGNLALGVVAPDAEAAAEALGKFWRLEPSGSRTTDIQSVSVVVRTRVVAPGDDSVVVAALEIAFGGDEAATSVARALLEERTEEIWPDADAELLAPFVPGRALLLLVIQAKGTVDEVEALVESGWSQLTAGVNDDELAPIRRRVAAAASAEMSGAAGHARRSAAVAAGASAWHQPAELELEILTVEAGMVSAVLEGFSSHESVKTTGAGVLPIADLDRR